MKRATVRGPVTPPAEPLLLESCTAHQVTANVNWFFGNNMGNIEVTLSRVASRPSEYSMAINPHHSGELREEQETSGMPDGNVGGLEFIGLRALVALHHVMGRVIEKAREVGWHDIQAMQHGGDVEGGGTRQLKIVG